MPLGLPTGLPAIEQLEKEGVQVVPLGSPNAIRLLVLNLMPLKEDTERQLARNFGQSPFTVDMSFAIPDAAAAKNTDPTHLNRFYKKWSELRNNVYDGVVITGAPVEHLPFEEVNYWPQLTEIMDWIVEKQMAAYFLCWGALASLYHYYGIPMHAVEGKLFGLYPLEVLKDCEMTRGLQQPLSVPVSRHVKHKMEDMARLPAGVEVIMDQKETGVCSVWDPQRTFVYIVNHFEYEVDTLDGEYRRDVKKGTPDGSPVAYPYKYFPDDDPSKFPVHHWRQNGITFYNNWILAVANKKNLSSKL